MRMSDAQYILAFDTANEVIAIGIGYLLPEDRSIRVIATRETCFEHKAFTQYR